MLLPYRGCHPARFCSHPKWPNRTGVRRERERAGARQIDVRGMTVMPGFIDDHRHVIGGSFPPGDPAQWMKEEAVARMQEFLDGGFTTIQSCGDPPEQIVELQRRLNADTIKGPRLFTAAFVQLSRPTGGS